MNLKIIINEELAEYRDGAYSDHGCARDQLEHFSKKIIDECASSWLETNPGKFEHRTDCQGAMIDTICLGCLISERDISDAAIESLRRIVDYYDNKKTPEYGMDMQSKGRHENTMFGEARAILAKVPNVKLRGAL